MDRDIHPAELPLFVAAALRGLRLEDAENGLYRVVRFEGDVREVVAERATFKDVANLCGSSGSLTLRRAAELDGLVWPQSAEAFIATMKRL